MKSIELSQAHPKDRDEINIGAVERMASTIAGSALAFYGLRRRSAGGAVLALLGGSLLYRGMTGRSLLYRRLGVNTADASGCESIEVQAAVTINRSPENLYHYWRNFSNLPCFMENLESVRVHDAGRSHWVAKAPLGGSVEWDAEITDEQPNRLIAWRSLPGSTVASRGTVRFAEAPGDRGTEVMVMLDYTPPGGALGAAYATLFGQAPQQQIAQDLRRFKQMMEAGEIPTIAGQASGRTKTHGRVVERSEPAEAPQPKSIVREASEQSFPASDPPAWTGSELGGRERKVGE